MMRLRLSAFFAATIRLVALPEVAAMLQARGGGERAVRHPDRAIASTIPNRDSDGGRAS